jgi:hypothetical protein
MVSRMNEMEDIRRRMRVSNLEARCELHEIEAAALAREITSPLTPAQNRGLAKIRLEAALAELAVIKAELGEMLRLFPHLHRK